MNDMGCHTQMFKKVQILMCEAYAEIPGHMIVLLELIQTIDLYGEIVVTL